MTPESAVAKEIFAWLKVRGVLCFVHDSVGVFDPTRKVYRTNNNPNRRKGVSDLLGVLPGGRFIGIEFKTPEQKNLFGHKTQSKGYLRPEQREFLEDVERMGGVAFVARSVADVEAELAKRGIALTNQVHKLIERNLWPGIVNKESRPPVERLEPANDSGLLNAFTLTALYAELMLGCGTKHFALKGLLERDAWQVEIQFTPRTEMNS